MAEAARPMRRVPNGRGWVDPRSSSWSTRAPRMAGIERRNEKEKASSRESWENKPAEIEAPDRETPGMMAIA